MISHLLQNEYNSPFSSERFCFQLNVALSSNICSFTLWLLSRGEQGQGDYLHQTIPYESFVQRAYSDWHWIYERYYHLSETRLTGTIPTFLTGDLFQDLKTAERRLLDQFQNWLGRSEIHQLERAITDRLAQRPDQKIDIFLGCTNSQLIKLPWEVWVKGLIPEELAYDTIRLIRTTVEQKTSRPSFSSFSNLSRSRQRCLVIIGYDPKLINQLTHQEALEELKEPIESLNQVTNLEIIQCRYIEHPKEEVITKITDDRGWDLLIFVGHSHSDGRFLLTEHDALTVEDIKQELRQAHQHGLKLTIFISCLGETIANSLTELGLQVIVMRERINPQKAKVFCKIFISQLKQHIKVQEALLFTTHKLETEEARNSPSIYLLPSFYCPINAQPYHIPPWNFWSRIKPFLPTQRESLVSGTFLLLSLMIPIQDTLLDLRSGFQALYHSYTQPIDPPSLPPISIVQIDRASFNQITDLGKYEIDPIDLRYLSKILNKLTKVSHDKENVIGISYLLDKQTSTSEKQAFMTSVQNAVLQQSSWFVFNVDADETWQQERGLSSIIDIQKNYVLYGDNTHNLWHMNFSQIPDCSPICSFASQLSLAYDFSKSIGSSNKVFPTVDSDTELYEQVKQDPLVYSASSSSSLDPESIFGIRKATNFAINPHQVYQIISAQDLLNNDNNLSQFQKLSKTIIIIAPGDYPRNDYFTYASPLALRYWCSVNSKRKKINQNCSSTRPFTLGELYAYQTYHFLHQKPLKIVPSFWFILMAIIVGKSVQILIRITESNKRRKIFILSTTATFIYFLLSINIYTFSSILIPLLLPSLIFWSYLIPFIRRKKS